MKTKHPLDDNLYLLSRVRELAAENERLSQDNGRLRELVVAAGYHPHFDVLEVVEVENELRKMRHETNELIERLTAENERLRAAFAKLAPRLRIITSGDPESMYNDLYYLAIELDERAEALAPDYFQRGVAAAPGLVMAARDTTMELE